MDLSPEAAEYVETWKRILSEWLRWPPTRIERFINRYEHYLTSPDSSIDHFWFFREPPFKNVIPLLIPTTLRVSPRIDYIQVIQSLGHAFWNHSRYGVREVDWEGARAAVDAVLERYGAKMPGPEQLAFYEEDDEKIDRLVGQAAAELSRSSIDVLEAPADMKPKDLLQRLLQERDLGIDHYNITEIRTVAWPPDKQAPLNQNDGLLTIRLQTMNGDKVLIFHCGTGWNYVVCEL